MRLSQLIKDLTDELAKAGDGPVVVRSMGADALRDYEIFHPLFDEDHDCFVVAFHGTNSPVREFPFGKEAI